MAPRSRRPRVALAAALALTCVFLDRARAEPAAAATARIAAKTAGMSKLDGFVPLYWDARSGKLWLEIRQWGAELLLRDALATGIGANEIGLDRGGEGATRVVRFERSGPRALLVQVNTDFRDSSGSADGHVAVTEAFPQSVLAAFDIAAEDGGAALVDATQLFLSDHHDVIAQLKRSKQGQFRLDATRSAIYLANTRAFPRNSEVEATLTFVSDEPGRALAQVVPNPRFVTVREHVSLIQLPPPGFKPRAFDARSGFFGEQYMDYATPIGEPMVKRVISRHRLQKADPNAAVSEPVKPLVYYLDRATPEPVRSALLDGARWWAHAFEAAGFRNAFRVDLLPPGADPMDVRYNVIEWLHRSTRGWSIGYAVTDPRTGEILKGHVLLDSLRVRQDYLILEGLLAPYERGAPADPRLLQTALARLRQLAAHEVGHSLGLQHNYIASTEGRASVMDYPPPLVTLTPDGNFDLSKAYATDIGEWDKIAIQYGYSEIPPGADEPKALDAVLANGRARGFTFLTDQDARPAGSADPYTHLWDAGTNAVSELERVLAVRGRALERFGERNIRFGEPLATLEDVLVPIYFYHRYQTDAAIKSIAGVHYTYALRGDGQRATEPVTPAEQRRALSVVLRTVAPATLTLPERLLALLPPRPARYNRSDEDVHTRTGAFDALAAAEAAAGLTLDVLFNGQRAARLVEQHARDARQPALYEVIDQVVRATWRSPRQPGLAAEVQRAVEDVVLYELMRLSLDGATSTQARAIALAKLGELRAWANGAARGAADPGQRAHLQAAAAQIDRFERSPETLPKAPPPVEAPPGQPIGCDGPDGPWAPARR